MSNVIGIIQARMGSTRLPGKTMTNIDGKPFLYYVIKSIKLSKRLDKIVIATSTNAKDDIIERFGIENDIPVFRGSEEDVLDRMYKAAKKYNPDFVVRLCGDNIFLNFEAMDKMIEIALKDNYDYVNDFYSKYVNEVHDTPTISGIVSEVLSMKALETMWKSAKKQEQREHITKYIVENPEKFKIKNFDIPKWLQRKDIRLTLDTEEDLKLIKILYSKFYKNKDKFDLKEIVDYLDKNPEIRNINLKK